MKKAVLCPRFISSEITDSAMFSDFFLGLAKRRDCVVCIDSEEMLIGSYKKSASAEYISVWLDQLTSNGSIETVVLPGSSRSKIRDYVVDTAINTTAGCRNVVARDAGDYSSHQPIIKSNGIELYDRSNAMELLSVISTPSLSKLEIDLEEKLIRIVRRKYPILPENYYNDLIHDYLTDIGCVCADQTRGGISGSGKGPGSLDIEIRNKSGTPITVLESLIVDSLDKRYIASHLKKCVCNYNTGGYPKVFVICFFSGGDFSSFASNYKVLISDIDNVDGYKGASYICSGTKERVGVCNQVQSFYSTHKNGTMVTEVVHFLANVG